MYYFMIVLCTVAVLLMLMKTLLQILLIVHYTQSLRLWYKIIKCHEDSCFLIVHFIEIFGYKLTVLKKVGVLYMSNNEVCVKIERDAPKHGSTKVLSPPPTFAEIHCSCNKVYHKHEVLFLLYILGQIVTWQYIPNPLD